MWLKYDAPLQQRSSEAAKQLQAGRLRSLVLSTLCLETEPGNVVLAVTPAPLLPFSYLLNIRGCYAEVEHRRSFDAIVVVYVCKGAGWLLASPNECFTEGVTHLFFGALLHSRHTHYRGCGKKVQRFGENKINLATLLLRSPALILWYHQSATHSVK